MSEIEKIQDRIDEYIRGTMSDTDRVIFENEIRQNADLRHEVEVQTSISDAVQAVYLKQVLQGVEAELTQSKQASPFTHEGKDKTSAVALPSYLHWRRFYQWAAVAAAVAIVFIYGNSLWQSNRIKGFGNEYYASLDIPSARDGNSLDSLLTLSYSQIGSEDYDLAEETLDKAKIMIEEGLKVPVTDEVSEYEHSLFEFKLYDAEWYHALIVMRQGKYHKAKSILKEIANGNGPYALGAKQILNTMYHININ